MESQAFDVVSLTNALVQGPWRDWQPANDEQDKLLSFARDHKGDLRQLSDWVGDRASITFLSESPGDLVVTLELELNLAWQAEATVWKVSSRSRDYAAFRFEPSKHVHGYVIDDENYRWFGEYPAMVGLEAQGGGMIYLAMAPGVEGFDLVQAGINLMAYEKEIWQPGDVIVPEVKLVKSFPMEWLLEMSAYDANGNPCQISEAHQEVNLKVDKDGCRLKTVTEAKTTIIGGPVSGTPVTVHEPFFLVICVSGVRLPFTTFWLKQDSWVLAPPA